MPLEVNESLLRVIAIKDKTISDGRTLAKKGSFRGTRKSADSSLIWAECQGSAKLPYQVSVDLAGEKPVARCTCPVRPPPCKHALGILVAYLDAPAKFTVAEPPADLREKREKAQERAEKRAEAAKEPPKVNQAALARKTAGQREALDLLERLILDLASGGLGTVDGKRAKKLADQARQMTDAYLKGAGIALQRLAALATAAGSARPTRPARAGARKVTPLAPVLDDWDEEFYGLREPGSDLPEEERNRLMLRHLTRLWTMVRKGKKYLEEKLEEGETQSDADAVVEELLGRDWKLVELKERGAVEKGLDLLELAYEQYDDPVRGERIEHSWLIDLADGAVHVDRTMRPLAALDKVRGGQSYEPVLTVAEAAIYPGFVNRRIRWDGIPTLRDPGEPDWARLHAVALSAVEAAVTRYKDQVKNPLSPDEAVFLLQAKEIVKSGADLALVDGAGAMLVLRDSPIARCRTVGMLEMAAGAARTRGALERPSSLLVRFWLGLADNRIYGQPLALVTGNRRIRLGM